MSKMQGIIENIVFQNEENAYVVANIKEEQEDQLVTIVGYIPYIKEGQNVNLTGEWEIHPQFGEQFKVEIYEEILPSSINGIEKYLASGIISGIGPVTAKKIVEKFGEDTLDILDNNIERLTEIKGIGKKKVEKIHESYSKQREIKNVMMFFQTYGVTTNQCIKIYKKYGENSINIVKENPYILTEDISGIGFKTADKIARSLGIESNSPFRIQSGINYVINDFCNLGNTYMPLEKLTKKAVDILCVSSEDVENNIYQSALEQKIKIEMIEGEECVFTIPYYYCELGVTRKILTLAFAKYDEINIDIDNKINQFEKDEGINFSKSQKEAIKGAFENGIEIITGGPGTGKTTIINCIAKILEDEGMKVFMAAPTGRAAKRMTEATGREAKTIHRLLEIGFNSDKEIFFNDDESILQCDVLIVDEASMIDIVLMNNLLKSIGAGTRLIIVGDVDQLPSVGSGNVLSDIIESNCVKVVRLKDIFRQSEESMIVLNAHKINKGEMPIFNKKGKGFYFINCNNNNKIKEIIIGLINERLPKYNSNWNKLKDIQIISPMRKGILGISNLNNEIQYIINPKMEYKKEKKFRNIIFRVGDRVMQNKNNYSLKWVRISGNGEKEGLGIFNGDIGYIEDIDDNDNVVVVFDEERRVIYENIYLDELELAYAITVHKSQGSEFPVVIMPSYMGPPLLMNRNLLYTGITRAKQLVVLVGSLKAVQYMVNNDRNFERYSSLKWRIQNVIENNDKGESCF